VFGGPADERVGCGGFWQRFAHPGGCLAGPPRRGRADDDIGPGFRPAQSQPFALIACPADNSDSLIRLFVWHSRIVAISPQAANRFQRKKASKGNPKKVSEKVQSTQFKSALITLLGNLYRQLREWIAEQFTPHEARVEWRALAKTFFKLGATGFGGGVAVIAQVRRLVVHQREWMTEEEFLDAVSLAQSLPGANAAN